MCGVSAKHRSKENGQFEPGRGAIRQHVIPSQDRSSRRAAPRKRHDGGGYDTKDRGRWNRWPLLAFRPLVSSECGLRIGAPARRKTKGLQKFPIARPAPGQTTGTAGLTAGGLEARPFTRNSFVFVTDNMGRRLPWPDLEISIARSEGASIDRPDSGARSIERSKVQVQYKSNRIDAWVDQRISASVGYASCYAATACRRPSGTARPVE